MNKFFILICSWIVRKALLDPRAKDAFISEMLDSGVIEEMMDRATERAIEDHTRECEHLSSNEVEDIAGQQATSVDYEDINGLEEFVISTVKSEVEDEMEGFETLAEEIREKIDSASNEIVTMTKLVTDLTAKV